MRFDILPLGRQVHRLHALALAVALAGGSGTAFGIDINTGNEDLRVRWDNQVRLNAGWRVESRDPAIANNPSNDSGDYKFDRGDMFSKRLDLFSEFDLSWQRKYGVRVSGAAWYDHAYSSLTQKRNPDLPPETNPCTYDDCRFSPLVRRYYRGGAEFLDAFGFANLDAGNVPVAVKLGRFSTFWGNAIFFQGGISKGQHPLDGRKSAASPGLEVKELLLPLTQALVQAQLTETVAVAAQYYFDWNSTRASEGGTYYGTADFTLDGPDRRSATSRREPPVEPSSKRGNWGVNVKYAPSWLGGQTIGVYYRKYDEKTPWLLTNAATGGYRAVYNTDAEMIGLGFDGKVGPVAVGAELGYHKNVALTTSALAAVPEGAKGNTWHALVNATYGLPHTALWETGTLVAELNYTRLDKVTANEALFNRVGAASCLNRSGATPVPGNAEDGCATSSAWGMNVSFSPEYPQLYPGVNVALPMTLAVGLKGNSPSALGVSKGVKTYSIGVRATIQNRHQVDLVWADSTAPMRVNAAGVATGGNGPFANNDRGRILLTYKTSF